MRAFELGCAYSTRGDFSIDAIFSAINEAHKSTEYRENARKVSVAIRDRLTPAMDKLVFWLRYMARIKTVGENLLLPLKNVNTYAETLQFLSGIAVGTFFTIFITMLYFATRFFTSNGRQQKSKGRYKR